MKIINNLSFCKFSYMAKLAHHQTAKAHAQLHQSMATACGFSALPTATPFVLLTMSPTDLGAVLEQADRVQV